MIALYLGEQLVDLRLLSIKLLARGKILLDKRAVALKVELSILQVGLILLFLRLSQLERCLIRPGIDLYEQIAFLHHLPLAKADFDHLTVDPAAH